jgi:hypothetical protein
MQRTTKTNSARIYSIILPLSLVRRLVGELDHPDPGAKLKELDPPKGLGEKIRKLVLGVDIARLEAPFLQVASDEVVPHPEALAPFIKNGVLYQGQSGLAVHPEFHRYSVSVEEITKQSNKPKHLSRNGGGCYVLGLATGQGHHLLLDRLPANDALVEEEEDLARALAGVDVAGVVPDAVPDKVCLPRAPRVVEAVIESPCNIADDPLHSLLVLRHRSLHEPTNEADGECQIWPCVGEIAKAPHKTSVLRSIHHLRCAVAAQLQPLFHQSESWVAVSETSQLNDALGVGGLSKRDPGVALVQPQVTHPQLLDGSLLVIGVITELRHLLQQSVETESKVINVLTWLVGQVLPLLTKCLQCGLAGAVAADACRSDGVPDLLGSLLPGKRELHLGKNSRNEGIQRPSILVVVDVTVPNYFRHVPHL